jgi:broad specificity phosphatase PhoE
VTIVVIQHGQAEHHVNGLTGGWTDSALTDLGRDQARRTAVYLSQNLGQGFSLVASDLRRTYETGLILADHLGTSLVVDAGLREINNGVAAHQTREWARSHRLRSGPAFDIDQRDYEGAETWREFSGRIYSTMDRITSRGVSNLTVVTHGVALSYVLKWWLGFSDEQQLISTHFQGSPGGISILETNALGQRTVQVFNQTAHLGA